MELIEPFGVQDIYVDGVGRVDHLNGNLRVVCYAEQPFEGGVEYVVKARIIISLRATPGAIMEVAKGAGMPCRCNLRLVKN